MFEEGLHFVETDFLLMAWDTDGFQQPYMDDWIIR